jgi:ribosomal protein L4
MKTMDRLRRTVSDLNRISVIMQDYSHSDLPLAYRKALEQAVSELAQAKRMLIINYHNIEDAVNFLEKGEVKS